MEDYKNIFAKEILTLNCPNNRYNTAADDRLLNLVKFMYSHFERLYSEMGKKEEDDDENEELAEIKELVEKLEMRVKILGLELNNIKKE